MKKKNVLFLLPLLLLSACDTTSSTSSSASSSTSSSLPSSTTSGSSSSSSSSTSSATAPTFDEVLPLFENGYRMKAEAVETTASGSTTTQAETQSQNDKITFRSTDAEGNVLFFETYYQLEGDELRSTRLDISNTVNLYPLYNPVSSDYYSFQADGFWNFFDGLTLDDFLKEGENYLLQANATLENAVVTQLYGNPGFTLDSLSLAVAGEDSLSFEADFRYSTTYTYHYEGTFTALKEGEDILERATPYPGVNDEDFSIAIGKLKAGDYTMVQQDYEDGELVSTANYKANAKGVSYQSMGYDMYYYVTDDGLIQACERFDDVYVRQGEPMEGSLDELLPSFRVSPSTLDKDGNTYTMKDDVEGELSVFTVLGAGADQLADLTITIAEDQIQVVNVLGDYRTELTFTDFGTTDHGIAEGDIQDPAEESLFVDLLEESSVSNLTALMGEEASLLPAPADFTQPYWIDWTEDPTAFLFFVYYDEVFDTTDEDIQAYGAVLEGMGYAPFDGSLNGGLSYTKTLDNGTTVYVEAVNDAGTFCLIFMDMANYDQML